MHYTLKKIDEDLLSYATDECYLNKMLARVLITNGYTKEQLYLFTHIDKALLPASKLENATIAAKTIYDFVKCSNNDCYIFADYDMDGITSGSILYKVLKTIKKATIHCHIPERVEGYGLNMDWVNTLIKTRTSGKKLVICVDNGTSCFDEIKKLSDHGITTIVLDHHPSTVKDLPALVVNPKYNIQQDYAHLAGCGVVFKVCQCLSRYCSSINMNNYFDLLALGTVADMMPLTLENQAYIYYGLKQMNGKKCSLPIQLLKKELNIQLVTYKDLGYIFAPHFNSCGRLGNMKYAFDYLILPAKKKAQKIIDANNLRKETSLKLVEKYYSNAKTQDILVIEEDYLGLVGILANTYAKAYNKNAVVLCDRGSYYKGSGRGYSSNLISAINSLKSCCPSLHCAGHNEAFGIKINKEDLSTFINSYHQLNLQPPETKDGENVLVGYVRFDKITINKCKILENAYGFEKLFLTDAHVLEIKPTVKNPENAWVKLVKNNVYMDIWVKDFFNLFPLVEENTTYFLICELEENFMRAGKASIKIKEIFTEEERSAYVKQSL